MPAEKSEGGWVEGGGHINTCITIEYAECLFECSVSGNCHQNGHSVK